MINRYHFSVLSYQDSLGESDAVPFAVLVESKRYVYCLAFHLTGDATSIAGQVRLNFPSILKDRVEQAAKIARDTHGSALVEIQKMFAWNIRASKPSHKFGFRSNIEQVATALFAKHVAKAPSAVPAEKSYCFEFDLPSSAFAPA